MLDAVTLRLRSVPFRPRAGIRQDHAPWMELTEDNADVARATQILDEDHYGLEDVKDRVLEFLAVRKLQLERMEPPPDAAADAAAEESAPRAEQPEEDQAEPEVEAGDSDGDANPDAEEDDAEIGRGAPYRDRFADVVRVLAEEDDAG